MRRVDGGPAVIRVLHRAFMGQVHGAKRAKIPRKLKKACLRCITADMTRMLLREGVVARFNTRTRRRIWAGSLRHCRQLLLDAQYSSALDSLYTEQDQQVLQTMNVAANNVDLAEAIA